jgi:hypothetical protein
VIPKIHRRGQIIGLGDLFGYLFGPGLDNERGGRHDNPRVIAAWAYATTGNLADLRPSPLSPHGRPSVRRLTELLEQPARICWSLPALPVWHCSIHNHPDDPILTDRHRQRRTGFPAPTSRQRAARAVPRKHHRFHSARRVRRRAA